MLWSISRIVLATSVLAGVSWVATAQVTFTNQRFVTGPQPTNVVSGDFNRDGLPDLAVTDLVAGGVTILVNVGGGHFAFGQEISTGLIPTQIVTGDFNHDGKLDLAVALSEADAVAIFLGNGDGTFRQGTSLALDGHPFALVAADFHHAGFADLAVVEQTPADTFNLKIFRSNGDGTFTRTQSTPLPRKAVFRGLMVSDDFNIDGLPDLAIATDTTIMIFTDSANGILNLHSTVTPPNTASITGLAAGRLTRGASPDLVVRVFDSVGDFTANSIYAFLNNGAGTFHLKSRVSTAGFGGSVYLADVDGDGLADLINVGNNFRNGTIAIATGHGDGTFALPITVENNIIGSPGGLVVRDLNLDSRHDLAIAGDQGLGTGDEATHVLINQNARTNCAPPPSSTLAVRICAPAANAGVRSTFTVSAAGNSPPGVKRMELWVDGVKRAQNFSDQLRAPLTLPLGTHRMTVVGVDLFDNLVKSTILVHVF
jgi:hypothetical protein